MPSFTPEQQPITLIRPGSTEAAGRGPRVAGWTGSKLLYWGTIISAGHIAQRQLIRSAHTAINFLLLVFGLVGVAALGWYGYRVFQLGGTLPQLVTMRHWLLWLFWLSVLTDTYLFYRMQTETDQLKKIAPRQYKESEPQLPPVAWSQLDQLKKDQKIDVSQYFTPDALQAVTKAWQLAGRYRHQQVAAIHLLVSLLTFEQTSVLFSRLTISFERLKAGIGKVLGRQAPYQKGSIVFSEELHSILFHAYLDAWELRQPRVDITELFYSVVHHATQIQELLDDVDIARDKVSNVIAWLRIKKQLRTRWQQFRHRSSFRPRGSMNRSMTAIATPILDTFSQDLTQLAHSGYLLPCIDRVDEIDEIFRVMHGGSRRNALLIGQSGVGRSTIVEGIAQLMVEDQVPDFLKDKRLVSLNVAKIVSGAAPTEAQERLLVALNEIERSGNIVLFISDIHTMVGVSAGAQGSIDLSDVLSQILEGQNVIAIATTTPSDYHRYIEGKSRLDTVFETVIVEEVSGNNAIQILEAKAGALEYQNQIYFSYDAIATAVELSGRYLHDRYLPEKAIEILQEVATSVRASRGSKSIISANDVAVIVSNKTKIPLTEITQEESEKLLKLEDKIHERIVDQEEAVNMVAASFRRARAEMRDAKRPIVNLLFLGPTGVGKTELAKTVAAVYFGAEENMIRLDMSEYQEKASINRLIGAPPGYSQHEGGQLTEAVRKKPFSLVLFDEIEKAHPDILNILLQVMDDGRLTDNTGRTVDFTNTIIIATSNAGTKFIQDNLSRGLRVEEVKQQLLDQQLSEYFRPEFINRFDGIVVFKPLSMDDVVKIAHIMLTSISANLEERGIHFRVTPEAVKELARVGYDPLYGARPLRRVIQERVQDALANNLLAGKISRRDTAVLDVGGVIQVERAKEL